MVEINRGRAPLQLGEYNLRLEVFRIVGNRVVEDVFLSLWTERNHITGNFFYVSQQLVTQNNNRGAAVNIEGFFREYLAGESSGGVQAINARAIPPSGLVSLLPK